MRKYGFFVFLWAAACPAADFFSGMAARAIIGQRTFTSQDPTSSGTVLGGVSGIAYANGTLFAVDDNRIDALPRNNRVVIFRNLQDVIPPPDAELPVTDERCPLCLGRADLVLGQPDFTKGEVGLSERGLNRPTGIATNGTVLAVADTDSNRVLIWRTLPTSMQQPADVVVGQPNFTSNRANEGGQQPTNRSLRGPEGVWIQGNRLFVADTLNNRVLIWRNIPTSNHQPADVVLGQPDFTTVQIQDLRTQLFDPKPDTLLSPVSVTSDGQKLFVTDLGYNRVLVWNSIPDANRAPADLAIGQPDLNSGLSNNTQNLCPEDRGKDAEGKDTFPLSCKASLDFPRFALSDGTRLFIADGGNDRVLVFNRIPTQSGQSADVILGQIAGTFNQVSDSANPLGRASADSVATPMALAWDGTNLYVSDPFRRRVLVFTPGEVLVPYTGVRNLFSRDVFAIGTITVAGTITADNEVTITVGDENTTPTQRSYTYKVVANDTFDRIIQGLVDKINEGAGDPQVLATPNLLFQTVVLTSRVGGEAGNAVPFAAAGSASATLTTTTSGATLVGGQEASKIAPGTLVTILGDNLADSTASAPDDADPLPRELAGVQVYFDGIRAPLLSVSPSEIKAQVPWDVNDANSVSAYVRIRRSNGRVQNTAAVAVPVIPQNPGLLGQEGLDPRPAFATHYSSNATGTISVDGSVNAGDVATVIIEDREYTYTVKTDDTLEIIRDSLINLINANPDEKVTAFAAGVFTRIRLRAKVAGAEGNIIGIATRVNDGAQVILTATNNGLCCANTAGAAVTEANPAIPGETIVVLATGLGLVNPDEAKFAVAAGFKYRGPVLNRPNEFVSSLAGAKTANVLYSGLAQGMVGVYEVHLELNSDLPTNPATQITIAQDIYVSNIVTVPLKNPNDGVLPPETAPVLDGAQTKAPAGRRAWENRRRNR